MSKRIISRRGILGLSATAGISAVLAACGATPTPQVIEKVVEREVTKIVEGTPQVVVETVVVQETVVVKETVQVAAPTAAAQGPIVLKMLWRITNPQEEPAMNALWDRFEELNPNIKISPRVFAPYPEVETKAQAWLAANDPMAIFECIAGPVARFLASREQCFPLQPFVDRDSYDLTDFYPMTMTLCRYRGDLIALPSMTFPTFMSYNKDLFAEAGLDNPPMDWDDTNWNWDTWMTYAQKLTKFGDDGNPTQYALAGMGDTRYFTRHYGLEWFNKEMLDDGYPKEFCPEREAMTALLQQMQDWMYKSHYSTSPAEEQTISAGVPLFKTGKIGTQHDSVGGLVGNADIEAFEYGFCPEPWPVDRPRWNYAYPDQWYIPKPQKYVDACWELMKFTVSEEGCKYHPIMSNTAIAPRMSMAGYYASYVMTNLTTARHEYTREELDFALKGMDYCQTTWAHGAIEYFRYWFESLQPNLEALFANEMTPEDCMNNIEKSVTAIMAETNPDWL